MLLKDKVAFITGGTRGIGFETARKFLEHGAIVVVAGSKEETVQSAVEKLRQEFPDAEIDGAAPKLTDPVQLEETVRKIKEKYGHLDVLVNNAGISSTQPFYDYPVEDFRKIMELNVTAVFLASQAAAKVMKEQGGGVILNTSSMVSLYGQSTGSGYPASKFAMNGLTKSLARELGKDQIRVNAVAPGIINTDMMRAVPDHMIQPLIQSVPLKRIGQPEDVANAFVFLASDMASYITGVVLAVDGAAMN